MDKKHNCRDHHGGNGFLLGVIVGALLVFLLGTDRGRRILKELSENGLEALENLQDFDEVDEYTEDDEVTNQASPARPSPVKNTARRLFRGIKKRAS